MFFKNQSEYTYSPFIVEINNSEAKPPFPVLAEDKSKQVMVQFLWRKQATFEKNYQDKFLIMIHEECISLNTACLKKKLLDDENKIDFSKTDSWYLDHEMLISENIVRNFTWAQWDPVTQALYYIHLKPVTRNILEKEENSVDKGFSPTLSAYQFHDDLPTETVVKYKQKKKSVLNLIKNITFFS